MQVKSISAQVKDMIMKLFKENPNREYTINEINEYLKVNLSFDVNNNIVSSALYRLFHDYSTGVNKAQRGVYIYDPQKLKSTNVLHAKVSDILDNLVDSITETIKNSSVNFNVPIEDIDTARSILKGVQDVTTEWKEGGNENDQNI